MARSSLQQVAYLLQSGNKEQAKQLLTEVLKIEPNNAEAWYMASFLVDDQAKATQYLERALVIDPSHSRAREALSKLRPASDPLDQLLSMPVTAPAPTPVIIQTQQPVRKKNPLVSCLAALGLLVLIVGGLAYVMGGSSKGGSSSVSGLPTLNPNPVYSQIDDKELATYADRYTGRYIEISGRVFNVIGDNDFQMYLGEDSYDAIYINTLSKLQGVYEKTNVKVQGMVYGFFTGKNMMNADIKQPLIVYGKVTVLNR